MTTTRPLDRPRAVHATPSPPGKTTAPVTRPVKAPALLARVAVFRCQGCGGWITAYRMDTQGCPTCRMLLARTVGWAS